MCLSAPVIRSNSIGKAGEQRMFKFRCVLEFTDIGMRKTMEFNNKMDMHRYASVCNARILSIEVVEVEEEWNADMEGIVI